MRLEDEPYLDSSPLRRHFRDHDIVLEDVLFLSDPGWALDAHLLAQSVAAHVGSRYWSEKANQNTRKGMSSMDNIKGGIDMSKEVQGNDSKVTNHLQLVSIKNRMARTVAESDTR